jgi:DNA processing protein
MKSRRVISARALGLTGRREFELWGELAPPPRLAVVGSRAAHRRFRDLVPALVATAARLGFSLASGGALGIDGDVHRAALDMAVPQVAVLPCGPDMPYPPAHEGLFRAVAAAAGAGVLFALERGKAPCRGVFASRNAIVVGVSKACVVVEAALRSGTMGTGRMCLRKGIPLAAVSGSAGAAWLVAAGAHPLRARTPDELGEDLARWLAALDSGRAPVRVAARWPAALAWLRTALADCGAAGLAADALEDPVAGLVGLLEAEQLGLVVEVAPGRYLARD